MPDIIVNVNNTGFYNPGSNVRLTVAFITTGAILNTPVTWAAVGSNLAITITFNRNIVLYGDALVPSNWVVTGSGYPVTVTGVSYVDNVVTLVTTQQQNGFVYTLNIPTVGVSDENGYNLQTFTGNFTGVGVAPTIVGIRVVDTRTINILFSTIMEPISAMNENNYSISPSIRVLYVTQLTPTVYQLTTEKQTTATIYTVTATNIKDFAGNSI